MSVLKTRPESNYDPFTPNAIRGAHQRDGTLREFAPVVHLTRYDVWAVAQHAECQWLLRDPETISSTRRPFEDGTGARPSILVTQDPPDHTRVRAVIHRALSPSFLVGFGIHQCVGQALARLEGQAMLGALLDRVERFESRGPAEVAVHMNAQLHEKLPVRLHPSA